MKLSFQDLGVFHYITLQYYIKNARLRASVYIKYRGKQEGGLVFVKSWRRSGSIRRPSVYL